MNYAQATAMFVCNALVNPTFPDKDTSDHVCLMYI